MFHLVFWTGHKVSVTQAQTNLCSLNPCPFPKPAQQKNTDVNDNLLTKNSLFFMYKYTTTWLKNKRNIFHGTIALWMSSFDASSLLLVLLVRSHEGGEDAVLLVQQGLGPVVLQDDPPLHYNHHVGFQDGVDAMLCGRGEEKQSQHWSAHEGIRETFSALYKYNKHVVKLVLMLKLEIK